MAALRGCPAVLAVSGVKNSGKTTFLEGLLQEMTRRGYRCAVIKHDGHDFEADVPGRDSYRLKAAGAYGCAVFSANRWMVVKEEADMDENRLIQCFPEADIIFLEGFKKSHYPKIEVVRSAVSAAPVCAAETLLAVATDLQIEGCRCIALDDYECCADIIEEFVENV